MDKKFTWKAEMAFEGASEEFTELKKSLRRFSTEVRTLTEKESEEKPVWISEIKFEGTAKEFNELGEFLIQWPIEIYIPEWINIPHHLAGCYKIGPDEILGKERFAEFIGNLPRTGITYIKDIRGGIRTPHIHVDGDVIFVDREKFKTFVKEIAQNLVEMRVENVEDYIELMGAIRQLYP